MDSEKLKKLLTLICKNSRVKKWYVISIDEWHKVNLSSLPVAVIMHTEPRNIVHGHYIAFWIDKSGFSVAAEMWDSLGNNIDKYSAIVPVSVKYMKMKAIQCIESKYCSYHCLFYLFHKIAGLQFKDIVNLFNKKKCLDRDMMVYNFIKKVIKLSSRI